jgi:hypothetical protein
VWDCCQLFCLIAVYCSLTSGTSNDFFNAFWQCVIRWLVGLKNAMKFVWHQRRYSKETRKWRFKHTVRVFIIFKCILCALAYLNSVDLLSILLQISYFIHLFLQNRSECVHSVGLKIVFIPSWKFIMTKQTNKSCQPE